MNLHSIAPPLGLLALLMLSPTAGLLGEGVVDETTPVAEPEITPELDPGFATEPIGAAADSLAAEPDSVAATPDSVAATPAEETYWVLGDTLRVPRSLKGRMLRKFISDSLTVNTRAKLLLHAEPHGARATPEEITERFAGCDSVRTAIPPGEWEVFLAVVDFDQIAGVMFTFDFPEDWIVHGFQPNPRLKNVFAIGGLKSSDERPRLIVFDCLAHSEHTNLILPGTKYDVADTVVIGSLDITATSPGTIRIVDHPSESYGPAEIATCLSTTVDIGDDHRGRIDVGRGPGKRLCAGEEVSGASRK